MINSRMSLEFEWDPKKLKPIVPLTGLILKKKRPKLDDPLKKE
jgi:hypothetical protein